MVSPAIMISASKRARTHVLPWLGLAGLLLGGACFIETPPPPAARYTCESTADCDDGETCASGLCQVPCTLGTFTSDCDQSQGFASCYNGYCAHLCEVGESNCTDPQSCIPLGFGTTTDGGAVGICGQSCAVTGCPASETCTATGLCATTCADGDATACAEGELCIEDICVPDPSTL